MIVLITLIIAIIAIIACYKFLIMSYKIAYYEQTLKNNRDNFSKERYKQIESVKYKKWILWKR